MVAPRQGFYGSAAVCDVVRRALSRAGLNPRFKGASLLPHSLAATMLRGGASLAEIGEILRHQQPDTTEIYAKVNLTASYRNHLTWFSRRINSTRAKWYGERPTPTPRNGTLSYPHTSRGDRFSRKSISATRALASLLF